MQVTKPASAAAMARRAQILEATIEAIAEDGYGHASFLRIAQRAGISSTRLISYHFADRGELMALVGAQVIGELGAAVEAGVRGAHSPAEAVRAYIEANVEFMDKNRPRIRALTSLLYAGALVIPADQATSGPDALRAIIAAGKEAGQFPDVDPDLAATIVQRTVEGVALQLREQPDADLGGYASKLVRFFDAALTGQSNVRAAK
jgi:AcrR family transcriptional regulator